MNENRTVIMDAAGVKRAITRIAHEIIERNRGVEDVVVIGIRSGGAYLAEAIAKHVTVIEGVEVALGSVDITLYRDDLAGHLPHHPVGKTDIRFSLEGKKVILVDDLLYTGRTIRAAMDALMDFGRPQSIQLAVLIDRGHRELPIRADFVGRNVPTSLKENVQVIFDESNQPREVQLEK